MAVVPRITVEELKRRMDAGEDFTVIDTRNPTAWAESDTMLPEAIRVPLDKLEDNLPRIPKNKSRTALDQMRALAPVWRRNFSSVDTKTCGLFRADCKHGRRLDSQLSRNHERHSERFTLRES
jgi:hypothetical protein